MTQASQRALPRPITPDALVLATRPLRPGIRVESTSRFGDQVWDLMPALHMRHHRRVILNFPVLPERFQQVANELFYALLVGPPPPGERQLHVLTIRGCFDGVKQFLAWLDEHDVATLGAVTAEHLEAYQRHLLTMACTAEHRLVLGRAVRRFWLYGPALPSDRLALDPARLDAWVNAPGRRDRENATARIPEAVLGPLLGWALRWVHDFADDVLGAGAEWLALHANTGPSRRRRGAARVRRGQVRAQLKALLDRYRAEQRPLPRNTNPHRRPGARDGGVNYAHLGREMDCDPATLARGDLSSSSTPPPNSWASPATPGCATRSAVRSTGVRGSPRSATRTCPGCTGCCRPPATSWSPTCRACATARSSTCSVAA